MQTIQDNFPYDEIRREDGNYFDTWQQAKDAGYADNQIWSIVEGDDDTWVYGPPHHYVNRIGYIATTETHDGQTYYEEDVSDIPWVMNLLEELAELRNKDVEGPITTTFTFHGQEFKLTLNEVKEEDS